MKHHFFTFRAPVNMHIYNLKILISSPNPIELPLIGKIFFKMILISGNSVGFGEDFKNCCFKMYHFTYAYLEPCLHYLLYFVKKWLIIKRKIKSYIDIHWF